MAREPAPDDDALAAAYRADAGFVWRAVQRLGVPADAAEDAVQEVFLVAQRRWPEFDASRASRRGWLHGIARGIASNLRRGRARADRKLVVLEPGGAQEAPDVALARADARRIVGGFLDSLEPHHREVFALVDIEGLRGPEVAAMLGIELAAVYSRLRLARKRFVEHLEANGFVAAEAP